MRAFEKKKMLRFITEMLSFSIWEAFYKLIFFCYLLYKNADYSSTHFIWALNSWKHRGGCIVDGVIEAGSSYQCDSSVDGVYSQKTRLKCYHLQLWYLYICPSTRNFSACCNETWHRGSSLSRLASLILLLYEAQIGLRCFCRNGWSYKNLAHNAKYNSCYDHSTLLESFYDMLCVICGVISLTVRFVKLELSLCFFLTKRHAMKTY
jgi:hypothetical protein